MPSNHALTRLLAETGWTQARLARAVNAAGAEARLSLRYDRSAVSHWLAGRRPWGPVPSILAEVLSRALGRTITVDDIGLAPSAVGGARRRTGTGDVAAVLSGLADSRPAHAFGVYSVAGLAVPSWTAARAEAFPAFSARNGPHLSAQQVAAAGQMLGLFSDSDAAFGGGRARAALAGYLAQQVAPCLHAPARPAQRTRMFSIATQLTYLCAFMCFDDEQHALAQRYYRAALDLAAENGDAAAYAIGLRALSVQACRLGHHRDAVQLAELAAATARRRLPPERQSFFAGQAAVALAAVGDRVSAMSALKAAERWLSPASSGIAAGPAGHPLPGFAMGNYHAAALAHQQALMCFLFGDRAGAIAAMSASIRHRAPAQRRSRAVTTARLAELQLAAGNLEEAVLSWDSFVDDYQHLRSGRASSALRTMRSRLRPYAANKTVGQLLARAGLSGRFAG